MIYAVPNTNNKKRFLETENGIASVETRRNYSTPARYHKYLPVTGKFVYKLLLHVFYYDCKYIA